MLRYSVEDGEAPGIVLGVLEANGATRTVAYGSAGPGAAPLGPRSEFEIGSVTKTFTATLLADMVIRGEVALSDPVSKYLPADVKVPSFGGKPITLEDLATHTSGLPRDPTGYSPPDPRRPFAHYTVRDLYAFLSRYTLRRAPGAGYEYSNLGYGLLGVALARAAGDSLPALVRRRILVPLGMDATGYVRPGDDTTSMVRGHADGKVVPYWSATAALQGAGGLRSDAEDMLKYLRANADPDTTELGRAMEMAQRIRVAHGGEGLGYGFSWQTIGGPDRPPVVVHGGTTGGFSTMLAFDPQRHIGTVLFANTHQFDDRLGILLIYPNPPPPSWHARVGAGVLDRYVGEYRLANGAIKPTYYVRLDQGHLTYQPPSRQVRTRLYARSDSSFYMLRGPWTVTFRTDAAGKVVGMVMHVDRRDEGRQGLTVITRKVSDRSPPPRVIAGHAGFWLTWRGPIEVLGALLAAVLLVVGLRELWRRRNLRPRSLS